MSSIHKRKMSVEQKNRLKELVDRPVVPTRFLDRTTLAGLDLLESTQTLLEHGGLGNFIDRYAVTYADLARQFIATYSVWSHGDSPGITGASFIYNEREYTLTAAQMHHALGITRPPTPEWDGAWGARHFLFWSEATGVPFRAGHSYNSMITHPSLRLCHKTLMFDFCGHKEDNKVPGYEFGFIWCLTPESDVVPCWLTVLFSALDRVRQADQRRTITMGGLITLLCLEVMSTDSILYPIPSPVYDLKLLGKTKLMRIVGQGSRAQYTWLSLPDYSHRMRLPRPIPVGPTAADFRLLSDDMMDNVPAAGPAADAEEYEDDDSEAPVARRRRFATAGPSSEPSGSHAGGSGYTLDPWQEQLVEQMRAMQVQQDSMASAQMEWQGQWSGGQTPWQQQMFEQIHRVDDRGQQLYDHQLAMERQQLEFQRQQEQHWMDLQRQQEEFFGRFPYPPPPPQ